MENEIWKALDGYNGRYHVSNYGRLKNVERGSFITLHKVGRKIVGTLSVSGKSESVCIASLVDEYFPNVHYFNPSKYKCLNEMNKPIDYLQDLANELWTDVVGYEGIYLVSSLGRVKGVTRVSTGTSINGNKFPIRTKEKILKLNNDSVGYPQVALANEGIVTYWKVHRLVATAFIPNPSGLPQVNHIDGDKANNSIENLEWVTAKDNIIHAHKTGLAFSGAESARAKLTWDEVRYIRNATGNTLRELASMFGVGTSTISRVINYEVYKNDPMEETK